MPAFRVPVSSQFCCLYRRSSLIGAFPPFWIRYFANIRKLFSGSRCCPLRVRLSRRSPAQIEPLCFLGNSVRKPDAPSRPQPENGTQETPMENDLQCSLIRQKTARLAAALQKVEAFAAAGGDLKSPAAFLDGWELVDAFAELAEEFDYEVLISINDRTAKPGGLFRVSVAGRSRSAN